MNASELMIGDYVYVNGNVTQIMQINEDNEVWTHKDPFIPNENVEPIPLTEKILSDNFGAIGKRDIPCISLYVNGNLYGEHFHYVHELQHALRLCGLNELADNFKVTA